MGGWQRWMDAYYYTRATQTIEALCDNTVHESNTNTLTD